MNRCLSLQNFFCLALLFIFLSNAGAQQPGFIIYMQSESNITYQVQWNGKTYPSSNSGYVMIPEMPAGEQVLGIVFATETQDAYTFTVTLTEKPKGFSLRQAIDNSWSMFDLVDFTLLKGKQLVKPDPEPIINKPADPVLNPVAQKKAEEKTIVKPSEKPVVKNDPVVVKKERVIKPASIQKIFDKSGSTGIDQVYIIVNGNKTDTIALFIPVLDEAVPKLSATNPSSRTLPTRASDNSVFGQVYIRKYALSFPSK